MKTYLVGGAVRDKLLGKQPHDKDYVVVGSTVSDMLNLGFQQVGKEFPVFLHPETNEEYALARKERKSGDKHTDFTFEFSPDVTLEDDLVRRDFTINAMALDDNEIVYDYFNGQEDLKNKLLKAVRPETFVEDPLRVLRGARFAAQLDFDVEEKTMSLFKDMVKKGMLEHLTAERVWKETEKALTKGFNSVKYFEVLNECGALEVLMPELHRLVNTPEQVKYHPSGNTFKHTMIALERVKNEDSLIKFMVACHDLGKGVTPEDILPKHNGHDERGLGQIDLLCDRLKAPNEYREKAKTFCKFHMRMARFTEMNLKKQYDMVKDLSNGFKDEQTLEDFIKCFYADWTGENEQTAWNDVNVFYKIVDVMRKVFWVMCKKTLKDLPKEVQERLKKFKGADFGKQYRDEMIHYLRTHLS